MKKLNNDFKLAWEGREYWLKLKEKYYIDDDCYLILFPEDDNQLNKSAIQNLGKFLDRKYICRAVILFTYDVREKIFYYKEKMDVTFERISQNEMRAILKYYQLTQFAKNIVAVSMEEPFGNRNIINKAGITLEDYVRNAIYA